MPRITPKYYLDWLLWAWEKQRALPEPTREAFLSETWGILEVFLRAMEPVTGGISLAKAIGLALSRFDPLSEVRNRIEKQKALYKELG